MKPQAHVYYFSDFIFAKMVKVTMPSTTRAGSEIGEIFHLANLSAIQYYTPLSHKYPQYHTYSTLPGANRHELHHAGKGIVQTGVDNRVLQEKQDG